jgi:cyclomaltodextrinase / maltogenic alpha-amylase / neopullulanase
MEIYFDSKDPRCKTPFGAVSTDDSLELNVYCKDGVFINKAKVIVYKDGQEVPFEYPLVYSFTKDGTSCFKMIENNLDVGLYWYSFEFDTEEGIVKKDLNGYGYQLTVYDRKYKTPEFAKGGIIYHIFVDRFNKGKDNSITFNKNGVLKNWDEKVTLKDPDGVYRANDFYGGNFQGIIDKLDYLKELNVSIIYLSPIFKSSSTHRYDTGDYLQVDELLGSEKKFKELIDTAHEKGMEIMLDGVFNHTGADSLYFNKFNNYPSVGAYQSKQSPYYNWYTFYDFPDNYHCWWGVTVCPTIKPVPNGFRDLITNPINGVIKKWTSLGVKGWRLDVVDELAEDFVKDIRKAIKSSNKDALMIGEVWEDASNKIAYEYRRHYFQGEELDGVMNYVFKTAILDYVNSGDAKIFKDRVEEIIENYPKQSLDCSMNLIGTHDTIRALTMLSGADKKIVSKESRRDYRLNKEEYSLASKKLKIASALQFILPGIPSIYYGDEIGMQGFEDPMNREPMNWGNIDEDIHNHYIKLGNIRNKYKNEMVGDTVIENNDGVLVIKRVAKKSITLVANTSGEMKFYELKNDSIDLLTGKKCLKGKLVLDSNFMYIFEE